MTIKLQIVDDHDTARHGLAQLLNGPHICVQSTTKGGSEAIALLESETVDAVLMDVRMPGSDGLATLNDLATARPQLPIVMISAHENPTYVARAAALGARDYLLKSDSKERMTEAITRAVNGDQLPETSLMRQMRKTMLRETGLDQFRTDTPLTRRELQVLRHIAMGLSNKEIAKSLAISVETVKEHVQNILRKVGASDRTDAAVRAVKMGMVD